MLCRAGSGVCRTWAYIQGYAGVPSHVNLENVKQYKKKHVLPVEIRSSDPEYGDTAIDPLFRKVKNLANPCEAARLLLALRYGYQPVIRHNLPVRHASSRQLRGAGKPFPQVCDPVNQTSSRA